MAAVKPQAQVVLVDKQGAMTSHDVVAKARRALGTRKIGHAGTLDPMATGLLVLGVEGATRLLTYVVGLDKTYHATIRLGQATTTDDAEGDVISHTDASHVDPDQIAQFMRELTGRISQVPSAVSAIKVDGKRAYDRVRAGEDVQLAAREVTVSRFVVTDQRTVGEWVDLDVEVDCSSGTYIRALARDLGSKLGVGGHLTALRRTKIGPFSVTEASTVESIGERSLTPAAAAAAILPVVPVSAEQARDLRHGKKVEASGDAFPAAAIADGDVLVGIVAQRGNTIKSIMNLPEETA